MERKPKKKRVTLVGDLKPMSIEELNKRISQSEADFKNGRYKASSELLFKYEDQGKIL